MPEIAGGKSYEETYKERNCQIGSTDGNYKVQKRGAYDVQKLRITFPEKKSGIPAFFLFDRFLRCTFGYLVLYFFQK